jgi:opacity protein-like surface antigen
MTFKRSGQALIFFSLIQMALPTNAAEQQKNSNIEETSTNYRILEVKEGEFHPKDESGKNTGKKFSAYFLSLESEDGEDEESYNRKNFNYIGIKAGIAMPSNLGGNSKLSGYSTDNVATYGFMVGRKINDIFALEFEYMYRSNSDTSVNTSVPNGPSNFTWGAKTNTFMFNASVDIIKHRLFRPYVKAGIGYSNNNADNYVSTATNNSGALVQQETYNGATKNEFAWQVGVGLNMTLNKTFDIDIEYMYVDRGKIKTDAGYTYVTPTQSGFNSSSSLNSKLVDNVITVGLKIKF